MFKPDTSGSETWIVNAPLSRDGQFAESAT